MSRSAARLRVAAVVVVGILLLCASLFVAAPLVVTADANCDWCHDAVVQGISEGTHPTLACGQCHGGNGFEAVSRRQYAGLRMLGATFFGESNDVFEAAISRETCLFCHTSVYESVVSAGGISILHSECAESSVLCSDCHSGSTHGTSPYPSRGISMDRCLVCHNGTPVSADCDLCHVDGDRVNRPSVGAWAVTHGPTWEETHGMGDLRTCSACHPEEKCIKCHDISLPHPAGYVNTSHSDEALLQRESCETCHPSEFCDGCHGLNMPHPVEFLPEHPQLVLESGSAVCETCHEIETCEVCHVAHTHPGNISKDD